MTWIVSETGVSRRRIARWVEYGLFGELAPGRSYGNVAELYTPAFLARVKLIRDWLDYYPLGPLATLKAVLYPEQGEGPSAPLVTPDHTELVAYR